MEKTEIMLSIIVPVYNVETYIRECLQSICSQYINGVEVIIVNDGSTDESGKICEEFGSKYSYFKVVNQCNAGLSAARNTGIKNANGRYLLFLDSDDYLNKGALENVYKIIEKEDIDFLYGKVKIYDCNSEVFRDSQIDYSKMEASGRPSSVYLKLRKEKAYFQAAWLVIPKREFIVNNQLYFYEGILHEDELWVPQVFANASRVRLMDEAFYVYRENRSGSIMNSTSMRSENDKLWIADRMTQLMDEGSEDVRKTMQYSRAALIYSLLIHVVGFKEKEQNEVLWGEIFKRIDWMNYGKYKIIFVSYQVLRKRLFKYGWSLFVQNIKKRVVPVIKKDSE